MALTNSTKWIAAAMAVLALVLGIAALPMILILAGFFRISLYGPESNGIIAVSGGFSSSLIKGLFLLIAIVLIVLLVRKRAQQIRLP